jgi:hypothetical protein
MFKIGFNQADIEALQYWRFQHPGPRIQMRMEALYLRSQQVPTRDIPRLCGISKAIFHRYLKAYVTGGMEQLQHLDPRQPRRALHAHRATLEAEFRRQPPETGIAGQPTQVRQCLKALGLKPRNVGMIPAKADIEAQETVKKSLEPRLAEATARQRVLLCMNAAHVVCAPFLGIV